MDPYRDDEPVIAREIPQRYLNGRISSFIVILIMVILLFGSVGIYLITNNRDTNIDPSGNDPDDNELVLDISNIPDTIISISNMFIEGRVRTGNGISVDQVSIAVSFPGLTEDKYRTFTNPEGRFSIEVTLPSFNSSGDQSMIITAEKEGYTTDEFKDVLPYQKPPEWTFMVYMSDCDLEAWALKDINEMESFFISENINLVVQLDRWESISSSDDRSNDNWTTTKRFLIKDDNNDNLIGSEELIDIGEINSADPEQVVDFATWTMERYPADHYGLILWNHGAGVDGICWEQSLDNEELITIDQLGWALDRIVSDSGNRLDIIGFDACLMSTLEVAYEINPYADFLIGSEVTEPGYGWDYTALTDLADDPYLSTEQIGISFVDRYISQSGDFATKKSISLGVYDLSLVDGVVRSLNDLSNTISGAGSSEMYNLQIARKYAQPVQEGHSSDAVDLYDMLENLHGTTDNSLVKEDARNTMELIDDSVVYFRKEQFGGFSVDGLNGFSIYAPDFREVLEANDDYSDLKMSKETSWMDLLGSYYDHLESSISNRVLDFNVALLSCSTSDKDNDGCRDTMSYHFSVSSEEDNIDAFLGINIYNLRGDHITSIGHDFNVSSDDPVSFTVSYTLDEGEGGPGLYRIVAYLCRGNTFDPGYFQDYTRSGYRWLEVYQG